MAGKVEFSDSKIQLSKAIFDPFSSSKKKRLQKIYCSYLYSFNDALRKHMCQCITFIALNMQAIILSETSSWVDNSFLNCRKEIILPQTTV